MSSSATASFFFNSTSAVHELAVAHPRTNNGQPYSYGTSGFRGLSPTLPAVTLRMGFLAALRSLSTSPPAPHPLTIGVMVTASHNDAPDNGVKLIDPTGEMMVSDWEQHATALANTPEQDVTSWCKALSLRLKLDLGGSPAKVVVGRDTRESSPVLCKLVVAGASSMGADVEDYGVVTTPQLHWAVRERNAGHDSSLDAYYKTLSTAFRTALEGRDGAGKPVQLPRLTVDCANGVGAVALQHLSGLLVPQLPLTLINTSATEHLNDHCGAEHVQKIRSLPRSVSATPPSSSGAPERYASLDGDADRLMYFFLDSASRTHLMDGDKTISLYTTLLSRLLSHAGLTARIGIVQTAYANGASTRYVTSALGIAPVFTPTGVKYLHHVAREYEVGIYFEANGHGTVLFSPAVIARFHDAAHDAARSEDQRRAASVLVSLVALVNQGVGDAISDLLLVEVSLWHLHWSLQDWDTIYTDLPSSMLKVRVRDRSLITTTDAERRCVTPAGLQDEIDRLVGPAGGMRRAFVRPSGTEDVVRVYAEAASRDEVDELAKQVCDVVRRLAGGLD